MLRGLFPCQNRVRSIVYRRAQAFFSFMLRHARLDGGIKNTWTEPTHDSSSNQTKHAEKVVGPIYNSTHHGTVAAGHNRIIITNSFLSCTQASCVRVLLVFKDDTTEEVVEFKWTWLLICESILTICHHQQSMGVAGDGPDCNTPLSITCFISWFSI